MTPTAGTQCLLHIFQEKILRPSPSWELSVCRPALALERQRWETSQTLPLWSGLWVGNTHVINQTTNKWLIFVMWSLWSLWRRENTETYDGVSDFIGKLCGGILGEIMFELRSKDILMKIGNRSFGKTWKWEQSPFSMISGLSLILVNLVNRYRCLVVPTGCT